MTPLNLKTEKYHPESPLEKDNRKSIDHSLGVCTGEYGTPPRLVDLSVEGLLLEGSLEGLDPGPSDFPVLHAFKAS